MRGLLQTLLKRLLQIVVILWATVTLSYLAVIVLPGDPVAIVLGNDGPVRPETVAAITAEYGLDKPRIIQYRDYLLKFAKGDLGQSYQLQQPVGSLIVSNLWPTMQLALFAWVMAVAMAFVFALVASGESRLLRFVASGVELVSLSMPSFFIALLLLFLFSFQLHWFPVVNAPGIGGLFLPAFALSIAIFGLMAQVLRKGIDDALKQPFSVTAYARGRSHLAVKIVHALRHAVLPVLTMSGTTIGHLLGGAVVTESIFGRAGLGRLVLNAVQTRDMPVVVGVVVVSATFFIAINILTDVISGIVDPRLRLVEARVGA